MLAAGIELLDSVSLDVGCGKCCRGDFEISV